MSLGKPIVILYNWMSSFWYVWLFKPSTLATKLETKLGNNSMQNIKQEIIVKLSNDPSFSKIVASLPLSD